MISGVNNNTTGQGQSAAGTGAPALGQQDFLKLMTVQMQNQDPFAPMENGEFLTQIAQFTSATGIGELQKSFEGFAQNMRTNQTLQVASLVGREVTVASEVANLSADGSLTGVVESPRELGNLKVGIYTTTGELVRELELGQQSAGLVDFSWDGKNADGKAMPAGKYYIAASTSLDGETYGLDTLATARVNSVALGNGPDPVLNLEGVGELQLSAVRSIR